MPVRFAPLVFLLVIVACSGDPATGTAGRSAAPVAEPMVSPSAAGAGQSGNTRDPSTAASPGSDGLDPPTRAYVTAINGRSLDALVEAFAPDGMVVDVGRKFRGREAIRGWAAREVIGGTLTVLEVRPYPGGTRMIVRFAPGGSGGFEACYTFDTAENHITRADLQYQCP